MTIKTLSMQFQDKCIALKSKSKFGKKAHFTRLPKSEIVRHIKTIKIPDAHYEWYSTAAPLDVSLWWTANELMLFDPRKLTNYQAGYRFHGVTGVLLKDWNPDWLVFASVGGDPIIANTGKKSTGIYMAYHGIGEWNLLQVAQNLEDFLIFLIGWCELTNKHGGNDQFHNTIYDDNSAIYLKILDEIKQITRQSVGEIYAKNLMQFLWG